MLNIWGRLRGAVSIINVQSRGDLLGPGSELDDDFPCFSKTRKLYLHERCSQGWVPRPSPLELSTICARTNESELSVRLEDLGARASDSREGRRCWKSQETNLGHCLEVSKC